MFEETNLIGQPPEPPRIVTPKILAPRGPLIKIARTVRWKRDNLIWELTEHFDNDERFTNIPDKEKPDRLTESEGREISRIYQKCREDFTYASRNFFWIVHKQRGDLLFALWEAQELILEHILRLKSQGIAQKVMILKARQLGCSTLIEALIAWRLMFFTNVNAAVVSYDPEHAAELFGIMQHIYDMMVWWLKPMCAAREYQNGLWFENPNEDERRKNKGLNSKVRCYGANKTSGVAQGRSINACHLSEATDWDEDKAREIIEEDVGNALSEGEETFAIWESTAKGAGSYSHKLWLKNVEQVEIAAENAEWYPLFLPWFFESTRKRNPEYGWRPKPEEIRMSNRIETDWTRCTNKECTMFHERWWNKMDREGESCPTCGTGSLRAYKLTPEQQRWMEWRRVNAKKDEESIRKLKQEQSSTSEEAWQVSGHKIFGDESEEYVNSTVRPPLLEGFFDQAGVFHAMNKTRSGIKHIDQDGHEWWSCIVSGCSIDHTLGDERGEHPLKIWKMPEPDGVYSLGADVAGGGGRENDFSVGAMIRIDPHFGRDELVAVYRSNTVHPMDYAMALNAFGRWYNNALLAVEVNRFDTCATWVRMQCGYPNLYRWKHMDSININSQKLSWETNYKSKPRLYHNMQRFLSQKLLKVYSRNFLEEMKTFRQEFYDELSAGAAKGCFVAGSMVTTKGFKPVPIEQIKAGDEVLTVSGTFEKVLGTSVRLYSGELHSIKAAGVFREIHCTDNHPFFSKMRYGGQTLEAAIKSNEAKWLRADQLSPGDLLCIPKARLEDKSLPDQDSLYAVGFYLAEGHLIKWNHTDLTGLALTNTNPEYFERASAGFQKMFPDGRALPVRSRMRQRHPSQRIYEYSFKSREAARWIMENCGEYSHLKHFPAEWVNAKGMLPLLAGWVDGDGSFRKRQQCDLNIYTVSEWMSHQGIGVLRSNSKWATMRKVERAQEVWRDSYVLNVKHRHIIDLPTVKKIPEHDYGKENVRAYQDEQRFFTPISEIRTREVKDLPVYNLTVDGDHTYVVEGVGVHNSHDDELMAAMISLWCAHESDYDENLGYVTLKRELSMDSAPWHGLCLACAEKWPSEQVGDTNCCPKCGSHMIQFSKNFDYSIQAKVDPVAMMMNVESEEQLSSEPDYNLL